MKVIQYITLFIVLLTIGFSSCTSTKRIEIVDSITISDYTAYVFRMCEYRNTFGNIRYFLCDTPCKPTDVQANDAIQVVEELYAFQSNTNPQDIIYITSKSDKYILEDAGIFNDDIYKKHIVVRDFEFVYFGKMKNKKQIDFVNPEEALTFWLQPVPEDCRFLVDSIYSETAEKNAISNKKLSFSNLFSVPVQFIETNRTLIQSRKDPTLVEELVLKDGEMYFQGNGKSYTLSEKRHSVSNLWWFKFLSA